MLEVRAQRWYVNLEAAKSYLEEAAMRAEATEVAESSKEIAEKQKVEEPRYAESEERTL